MAGCRKLNVVGMTALAKRRLLIVIGERALWWKILLDGGHQTKKFGCENYESDKQKRQPVKVGVL